jgi:hypothetical protein
VLLAQETHAIQHLIGAIRRFAQPCAQFGILGLEQGDPLLSCGIASTTAGRDGLQPRLRSVRAFPETGEFLAEVPHQEFQFREGPHVSRF